MSSNSSVEEPDWVAAGRRQSGAYHPNDPNHEHHHVILSDTESQDPYLNEEEDNGRNAISQETPSSSNDESNGQTSNGDSNASSSQQQQQQRPNYTVDICATCLVSKPPKLPLREELPSLGFELIYNARGVGAATAEYQSRQQLQQYRNNQTTKENAKRRLKWLPRSPRKVQQKLQKRLATEEELKIPTALSYEAYEYGLESFDLADAKVVARRNNIRKATSWNDASDSHRKQQPNANDNDDDHDDDDEYTYDSNASSCSIDPDYPNNLQQHMYTIETALSEGAMLTGGQKKRWGTWQRQRRRKQQPATQKSGKETKTDIHQTLATAQFGDLLAPVDPIDLDPTTKDSYNDNNKKLQATNTANSLFHVAGSTQPLVGGGGGGGGGGIGGYVTEEGTLEEYTIDEFPDDLKFIASEDVQMDLPGFSIDNAEVNPLGVTSLQDDELPHSRGNHDNADHTEATSGEANGNTNNNNVTTNNAFDDIVQSALNGMSHNIYSRDDDTDNDGDGNKSVQPAASKEKERDKVHNAFAKLFAVFATSKPNNNKSKKKKKKERESPEGNHHHHNNRLPPQTTVSPTALAATVSPPLSPPQNEPYDFLTSTDDEQEDNVDNDDHNSDSDVQVQQEAATTGWMETTRLALETVTSGGGFFDTDDVAPMISSDKTDEEREDPQQMMIPQSPTSESAQPIVSEGRGSNPAWMWNATSGAIHTAASDFAKVTGLVPSQDERDGNSDDDDNDGGETNTEASSLHGHTVGKLPVGSAHSRLALLPTDDQPLGFHNNNRNESHIQAPLLEILESVDCNVFEIQDAVRQSPELAQVRQNGSGRYPLHTLCARGMRDRSNVHESDLTDFLLNDVIGYKECMSELLGAYPAAALVPDHNQDLPAHLLARTLMEWEACWYESVYSRAACERDPEGVAAKAITSLYHGMSCCVEVILRPIVNEPDLCQCSGSIGQIYPLHIATIFTSTIQSLTSILNSYPKAASIPCDLDDLGTFIPDNSLPLVLHDSLSTDFPKWELNRRKETTGEVTPADSVSEIRRSDLLFSYYPDIKPYRLDSTRIRRLENRLRNEASEIVECERSRLSQPMERFWVWLCTFQDFESRRPAYSRSVKRVVKGMPLAAVHYLASVTAASGRPVLSDAAPKCAAAIRVEFERTPPVQIWESQANIARLLTNHKGFVAPFARTILNIKERRFPTSFVILPYRLEMNSDGTVGVKDTESFAVAAKFAECLLRLSDPRAVLYYIDRKSKAYYNQSLYKDTGNEDIRQRSFQGFEAVEAKLVSLYKPAKTYLYLLDEDTAMPIVPDESENSYPIILNEPGSMIKRLLPLMLPGMVLMRGDKALSVLMNVILDSDVSVVPSNWVVAANNLSKFLSTRGNESFSDISVLRDCVAQFLYRAMSLEKRASVPRNCKSEWGIETATLHMLLETNTALPRYAGLRTIRNESWALYWTKVMSSENSIKDRTGMDLDELAKKHDDLSLKLAELRSIEEKDVASFKSEQPAEAPASAQETVYTDLAIATSSDAGVVRYLPTRSEDNQRGDSHGSKSTGPLNFPCPPSEQTSKNPRLAVLPHEITSVMEEREEDLEQEQHEHDDAILRARNVPQQIGASVGDFTSFQTVSSGDRMDNRYRMLFGDLAVEDLKHMDFNNGCSSTKKEGASSNGDRIWNDIRDNLDNARQSAVAQEDVDIIRLKLMLAEEARKSGDLSKRVRDLTKTTERYVHDEEDKFQEQTLGPGVQGESKILPSLQQSRKLLIRLCDLEERLLCDEIDIQHLRMESLSMYYEIEEIDANDKQQGKAHDITTSETKSQAPVRDVFAPAQSAKASVPTVSHISSLTSESHGPPREISMIQKSKPEATVAPPTSPSSVSSTGRRGSVREQLKWLKARKKSAARTKVQAEGKALPTKATAPDQRGRVSNFHPMLTPPALTHPTGNSKLNAIPYDIPMSPSTRSTKSCTTDPGSAANPVIIVASPTMGSELGSCVQNPLDLTALDYNADEHDGKSEATSYDLTSCDEGRRTGDYYDQHDEMMTDFHSFAQFGGSTAGSSIAYPLDLTQHTGTAADWVQFHRSSGQIEL